MSRSKLTGAQQQWLDQELAGWQADHILTPEQAAQIRGRYESVDEINDRKRSAAVQALYAMAAFLFGLAVLLLIGFNWDALSRELKLVVVLSVVTITHVGAIKLRSGGAHVGLSEVVSFLGCLFYGAGIWLVAQAYHLEAHYPDGVWWWAIGVLPFALCLQSMTLHVLYVFLLGLWASIEVFGYWHLGPWWMGGWRFPNGAYSMPLLALPGLIWAYQRKSPVAVGLYVPLLAWWTVLQAFAMGLSGRSFFWIGNVCAILILLAEAHPPRDPRGVPYRFWGVAGISMILLAMGSTWFWQGVGFVQENFSRTGSVERMVTEVVATCGLLVISAAVLFAVRGAGAFDLKGGAGELDSARRRWFSIILVGCLMFLSIWSLAVPVPALASGVPIVIANLLTLGLALYLVKVGEQEERSRPFAIGVLLFTLWTFIRYIDLFGEAGGMLGAALVFAGCGVGLVLVGVFWSRRRRQHRREAQDLPGQPLPVPGWVNSTVDFLSRNRLRILTTAAIAHVTLLGGMILLESLPLLVGQRVILDVTPVDPRDLFRGDYVILNYPFNNLPIVDGETTISPWNVSRSQEDEIVYVSLEQAGDGATLAGTSASLRRPAGGQRFLKGRITGDYRQPLKFGIEAYYVQEGKGKVLENLRNARKLKAEIALAPWGQAKLVRVFE